MNAIFAPCFAFGVLAAALSAGEPPAKVSVASAAGAPLGIAPWEPRHLFDWPGTSIAPGYAMARAHEPSFNDKSLWPALTGKEAYFTETWPKARLLVWSKPGVRGVPKNPRSDELLVTEAANWLEDGKPATDLWDSDTDILLPAADKAYEVSMRDCGVRQEFRHITVESNAALLGGGDGVGRQIHGCVWIKKGGQIGSQGATSFLGPKHVFVRNDNPVGEKSPDRVGMSQYFNFAKAANASVEILGAARTGDEFGIHGCTVIVGPDTTVSPGRNASPEITDGGTMALMDGAVWAKWANDFENPDLEVNGNLQGGLPNRPLARSCVLRIGYKNWTLAKYVGGIGKQQPRAPKRVVGLVLRGGSLRSFSSDPAKARLVISYLGDIGMWDTRAPQGSEYEKEQIRRDPIGLPHFFAWLDGLPRNTTVFVGSGVQVEAVEFDWLHQGGLLVQTPADMAKWKQVSYGPNCAGKPEILCMPQPELGKDSSLPLGMTPPSKDPDRAGSTAHFSPASGPATSSFNGLHPKSKFLAIILFPTIQ